MQPGMSVSYVARRAGVAPSLLFNWRRRMLEGGLQAVQADEEVVGTSRSVSWNDGCANGVVIALRSNIRWCSDHFEPPVVMARSCVCCLRIHACDREVIGWLATSAGISGEMVRDLMIACVERRFGISKAAHPVEWLSDNGSAYIAKDTLDTATALGLKLCFTPVRSPESNGIAEAFVKTFKRDYARLSILPDAETVIALLTGWFEDYNGVYLHSGLKFLSPREFLRLSA